MDNSISPPVADDVRKIANMTIHEAKAYAGHMSVNSARQMLDALSRAIVAADSDMMRYNQTKRAIRSALLSDKDDPHPYAIASCTLHRRLRCNDCD